MMPMSKKEPAESSRVISFVWWILVLAALGLFFLPELLMFFPGGFFDEWGRNTLGEDYLLILVLALIVFTSLATIVALWLRRQRRSHAQTRSAHEEDTANRPP